MKIILSEYLMDLRRTFRYKTGIVLDIVVFTALLMFFLMSNTGESFTDKYHTEDYKTLLLLGYIAWNFSSVAVSVVTSQISSEIQRGTFYLKLNSKCPLQFICLGNLFSAVTVQLVVVLCYGILTLFLGNVSYFINLEIILSMIIGIVGMYGVGLIIAGFSLFFKRVGSLIFLFQLTLLFVTDTVPTSGAIMSVTNVIPLTKCNEVIRNSFLGLPVSDAFLLLCVYSAAFFIVGYFVFEFFLRCSKQKGNLLLY